MPKKVSPLPHRVEILKIPFDRVTLEDTIKKCQKWLKEKKKQRFIATPNPEILLKTQTNPKYKKIIQKTDLNIADGIGVLWAATFKKDLNKNNNGLSRLTRGLTLLSKLIIQKSEFTQILPERVTGTDLMDHLITSSKDMETRIFLLGAGPNVAHKVKKHYEEQNENINIVGTYSGSPAKSDEQKIISKINETNPNLLFVAFGAPKQELWIDRNLNQMPSVKLAIGVGGAFDFIAGKTKRAPKWMRKSGLEWLYRLIRQPSRIIRIYNATIKFPLTVIRNEVPFE